MINITNFETNSENLAVTITRRKFVGEGVVLCTKICFEILSWKRKIAALSDMTFVLFVVDSM